MDVIGINQMIFRNLNHEIRINLTENQTKILILNPMKFAKDAEPLV
jgi:hypothetical protein